MKHAFALFLTLAATLCAQDPTAQPPRSPQPATPEAGPAEPQKKGSVEGRVVSATGEPLRRANVSLIRFGRPGVGGGPAGAVGAFIGGPGMSGNASAVTDAEGAFVINDVEPGSYRIWADKTGFVRQEFGARAGRTAPSTVTVNPGQAVKDLTFKLIPQAVVAGRVADEEGEPIQGAMVQVMRTSYMRGKKQLVPAGMAQSNDLGEYRVPNIAPGRYYVRVAPQRRGFGGGPGSVARRAAGASAQEYSSVFYPNSPTLAGAVPIELTAGQELRSIDVALRPSAAFHIRGKVVDENGQPVQNVGVMVSPRGESGMGFVDRMGAPVRGNGVFEIAVPPGSYTLMAMQGGRNNRGGPPTIGRVQVDVANQDVEGVTVALTPGTQVSGTVKVKGPSSALLTAMRVMLNPAEMMMMGPGGGNAQVNADGSFMLENVASDRYTLNVVGLPEGFYVESARYGDADALKDGLSVAGAGGNLEITVNPNGAAVQGGVFDAKQQPVQGAMVTLIPEGAADPSFTGKFATTDQNGSFRLSGLAPGNYKVYAWEEIEYGAQFDPEFVKPYETKAASLSVREGSSNSVTLALIPSAIAQATAAR